MLTTEPRRAPAPRTLGWLSVLTSLGAALFGCPDALHLDPGTSANSSSGSGAASGGGAGALPCRSSPDCPFPTPVCDTVKQQCVECLVVQDCMTKSTTVCSKGACVCADTTQTFCAPQAQQPGQCVDTMSAQKSCGSCGHACFNTCAGGICIDGWTKMSVDGAPDPRIRHVAVWDDADKLMIVWGGITQDQKTTATGGVYNLLKNTWTPTSMMSVPAAREGATAVWDDADKKMIVWGGTDPVTGPLNTGGAYDPKTDTWKMLSTGSAPTARFQHTAVWTSTAMIVWGGSDGKNYLDSGASYDFPTDTWTMITNTGAPSARALHTAVWDGSSMLVWGGFGSNGAMPPMMPMDVPFNDGASFVPGPMMGKWNAMSSAGAVPAPRSRHTAVWNATAMLVFGGNTGMANVSQDGGKYLPTGWTALGVASAPEAREDHTAVWIPATNEMLVWGGEGTKSTFLNTGYRLDGASLAWKAMPTALSARARHTAVVAGSQMIIWGGETSANTYTNTGGIFDAMVK